MHAAAGRQPANSVNFMTDAMMTVTNDYPIRDEMVVTADPFEMYTTFPDQNVAAGKTSPAYYVAALPLPGQSQFTLSYQSTGEDMTVKIGSWPERTEVDYVKVDGGAGAMLAPMPGSGTDYTFSFFAGPNRLKKHADSFLDANLDALIAWLAANPQDFTVTDGVVLTVALLDLAKCEVVYAAVTPTKTPAKTSAKTRDATAWQLTAIAEVSGRMYGELAWDGSKGSVSAWADRLSVLVQASIDLSSTTPACTVTRLEFSIGNSGLASALTDVIEIFFPLVYAELTSPVTLARALNTGFNGYLIDKVNELIAKILPPTALAGIPNWLIGPAASRARRPRPAPRPAASARDYSTWMSAPDIQRRRLSELTLPGTHDSATYGLTPVLSQIKYSDIAFLWTLSPDHAPADGTFPFANWPNGGGTLHVGTELVGYVLDKAMEVSIAQDKTIREQLEAGIRYFDLRIYYDADGHFYAQHAVRGPRFEELLGDVRAFIDAHPHSGELVFLQISATNFGSDQPALPDAAARLMRDHLDRHIYLPSGAEGQTYDFQRLAEHRLDQITHGEPTVILLNTDDFTYANTVLNSGGFANSGHNKSGTDSLTELMNQEGDGLDNNTLPLYEVSWTLTPQSADITNCVLRNLSDRSAELLIGELAIEANTALAAFFADHRGRKCNLVTVDWYQTSSGALPVDVIIGLNYPAKPVTQRRGK